MSEPQPLTAKPAEPRPMASLNSGLLARKGAARPAMRPQLTPLPAAPADDLGWNDMGHGEIDQGNSDHAPEADWSEVAPAFAPAAAASAPATEVHRRQQDAAARLGAPRRRSALAEGRRAAFTLRVDAERHLKLRLACTLHARSAQALVTEALDRLIDELPDVTTLAEQVGRRARA